ncbi:MAG TPA: plastocyanin/azurin family copper-binding protein [Gemmatimonadales bacterium]|nr:plastocyanin/azurin family copper-binding protein [Gemmatimonadales bacterium]
MRRSLLLGFALLGSLVACSSSTGYGSGGGSGNSNGMPGADQVFMQNVAFVPATRTVSVGTTVQWVNQDGFAHTVTKDSGPGAAFSSGNIGAGAGFSVRFDSAGTYQYHCSIHGSPGAGMHGTVIVQ